MEASVNNKIRLGLFVTVGIIFLITGIYFIGKRQQIFSSNFQISGIFKNVSGLQIGNSVRFAGIDVGIVEDIVITSDTTVKVDLLLDQNVRKFIKKDARATIGNEGLMGNKIVIISPGRNGGEMIENNDIIATSVPLDMDDMLNKLNLITDNAAMITTDLSEITNVIRAGEGTIGKLFMDTVFAENIDRAILNIRKGAGGFQQNMEAAKSNILLRGYFKRQEREKEKKQKEQQEKEKKAASDSKN